MNRIVGKERVAVLAERKRLITIAERFVAETEADSGALSPQAYTARCMLSALQNETH